MDKAYNIHGFVSVTCICATPGYGAGYRNNKMICTDGFIAYCAPDEECYETKSFNYEQLYDGCRPPGIFYISKTNIDVNFL